MDEDSLQGRSLLARRGAKTSTAGLWDQGLFTDAISSAVAGTLMYSYTYLQSPRTAVWRALAWPPADWSVANISQRHVVPWYDTGDRRADRRAIEAELERLEP